jgi:hypothetical protein
MKRRDHLGDVDVDGRIILNYVLKKLAVDWIHVDEDKG